MARGKKSRLSVDKIQAAPEPSRRQDTLRSTPRVRGRFNIVDYIVVLVFFVLFCMLQKFVAIQMLGGRSIEMFERQSLDFFFNTLAIGFAIVLVLVGLYDFFYKGVEEEEDTF